MENLFKSSIAVAGATATFIFGGWSALLGLLLAFIVIDYLSGMLAAGKEGALSSRIGMRGIAKKVMILALVAFSHLIDEAIGTGTTIKDGATYFYLANEGLSIIENAGRLNVPIPGILTKAVAVLKSNNEEVKKDA